MNTPTPEQKAEHKRLSKVWVDARDAAESAAEEMVEARLAFKAAEQAEQKAERELTEYVNAYGVNRGEL